MSCLGLALYILTTFNGGMIIYLFSHFTPIIILLLLYIISAIILIVNLLKTGIKANKPNLILHTTLWIYIGVIWSTQSEIFKSERILSATLRDDLYDYELVLRKNGKCETNCNGIFGFYQTIKGEYTLCGDTIKFIKLPYDTQNFITQKLLIVRDSNAVFMQTYDGKYSTKKEFLAYFDINEINIQ